MIRKLLTIAITVLSTTSLLAQKKPVTEQRSKPKLVVGIVVDQMRWDYLIKFKDVFQTHGGFERMMNEGFSCNNTYISYLPSVTACGHAGVYTGSVPALHGIVGNNWYDNTKYKEVYCVEDSTEKTVGSKTTKVGKMSPRNLWATTITDELRLSSNFRNKVFSISMKDRGAIIPGGYSANAAYWYDNKTGAFVSNSYYKKPYPEWLYEFNETKKADSLYQLNWDLSLAKDAYVKWCDADMVAYESDVLGTTSFPHSLYEYAKKDYEKLLFTPHGNTLLTLLAKQLVTNEKLGSSDSETDFLAISYSSTDYVGHGFGPNSWEMLDTYNRLNNNLEELFKFLDQKIGRGNYTVFLTADHAVCNIPEYLNKNFMPSNRYDDEQLKNDINQHIKKNFNIPSIVTYSFEHNLYFNRAILDTNLNNEMLIKKAIKQYLLKDEKVLAVIDKKNIDKELLPEKLKQMIMNGHNEQRSGEMLVLMKTGVIDSDRKGTTHGVWNTYDTHIPLLWMGYGINKGNTYNTCYMTDIAPTVAALLHIQMPSSCIGQVIPDVLAK